MLVSKMLYLKGFYCYIFVFKIENQNYIRWIDMINIVAIGRYIKIKHISYI